MFKNRLLNFIGLVILVLFFGTGDVYAAKELDCFYALADGFTGIEKQSFRFHQYADGELNYWYVNDDFTKYGNEVYGDVNAWDKWSNGDKAHMNFTDGSYGDGGFVAKENKKEVLTTCPPYLAIESIYYNDGGATDTSKHIFEFMGTKEFNEQKGSKTFVWWKSITPPEGVDIFTPDEFDEQNVNNLNCDEIKEKIEGGYSFWLKSTSGLKQACLYIAEYNTGDYKNSCLIYQLNFESVTSINGYFDLTNKPNITSVLEENAANVLDATDVEIFINSDFACPLFIYGDVDTSANKITLHTKSKNFDDIKFKKVSSLYENESDSIISGDGDKIDDCEDLIGEELRELLDEYMHLFRMIVPIIVIVLGIVDFAAAMFSQKDDNMKKNVNKFVKRLIVAVVIFLIPTLVNVLLDVANTVWGWNAGNCGIK